jgi:hypothetical protein
VHRFRCCCISGAGATFPAPSYGKRAYTSGGKMSEDIIFIPIPAAVVADIKKHWATEITGPDGKPVFSGT